MVIIYDIAIVLALLTGAAIGLLVTAGHYEQIARRHWAYEKEMAERRELYAALGMLRHIRPHHSADDEETAA
jgi:type II secretory pathway component PulJ